MSMNFGFTIPLSDILMFGVIIFFGFYGYRRGVLKELISVLRLYFSFIFTVLLYERAAILLQAITNIPSWFVQMLCFSVILIIFLVAMWAVEIILRKKITPDEKTGSVLSKVGGVTLGLLEGILLISIMIMDVEFYPTPEGAKYPFEGAVSYKVIKQVAPSIKDFTVKPVSMLKDISDGTEIDDMEEDKEKE
jgi:uncharacterized membrane protein required for colicin V production